MQTNLSIISLIATRFLLPSGSSLASVNGALQQNAIQILGCMKITSHCRTGELMKKMGDCCLEDYITRDVCVGYVIEVKNRIAWCN